MDLNRIKLYLIGKEYLKVEHSYIIEYSINLAIPVWKSPDCDKSSQVSHITPIQPFDILEKSKDDPAWFKIRVWESEEDSTGYSEPEMIGWINLSEENCDVFLEYSPEIFDLIDRDYYLKCTLLELIDSKGRRVFPYY